MFYSQPPLNIPPTSPSTVIANATIETPLHSRVQYKIQLKNHDTDVTMVDTINPHFSTNTPRSYNRNTFRNISTMFLGSCPTTHTPLLQVKNILPNTMMACPGNSGFIADTLAEDGDVADVLVLGEDPLQPFSVIECRVVGYLDIQNTMDTTPNIKFIAVPSGSVVYGVYDKYVDIRDLPHALLERVHIFYQQFMLHTKKSYQIAIGHFYGIQDAAQKLAEYRAACHVANTRAVTSTST